MFERLAERVNANEKLVRRGRYVTLSFLLEAGEESHIVSLKEGVVGEVVTNPSLMPAWVFALRGTREGWEKFLSSAPPPGFTDIFALQRKRLLRMEGNLQPFMANLFYFKGLLASLRVREAG